MKLTETHDFTISFDWNDIGAVYITNAQSGVFEKRVVLKYKALALFKKFLMRLGKQLEKEDA